MFVFDETFFNPCVKIILGLDILEGFLLLVNVNNVGVWIVLMSLDEVLHHIAFAHTTSSDNGDDIAFTNPRVHNISVIPSC